MHHNNNIEENLYLLISVAFGSGASFFILDSAHARVHSQDMARIHGGENTVEKFDTKTAKARKPRNHESTKMSNCETVKG